MHATGESPLSVAVNTSLNDLGGECANGSTGNAADGVEKRQLGGLKPSEIELVDAYFRHVNKAYPFIDRARISRSATTMANFQATDDPESATLYLAMAIGCTTLERGGRIPRNSSVNFCVPYTEIIQICLVHESGGTVQNLLLLTLYSLFDPEGPATCSLLAIITRQAQFLGLTRRNYSLEKTSPQDTELHYRLYWSIYILDRMMTMSIGLPCLLDTEGSDVPLPSVTVQEFASCERPKFASCLQTNRYVIQLRQIEGSILSEVHLRSAIGASLLAQLDRKAISSRLRLDLENWYAAGCLICPPDSDSLPIRSSLVWLNARYYHLLILLYYPCCFNIHTELATASKILCLAQEFVHCNSVLLQQGQLPLNRVTLYRMLPICLVFVYCCTKVGERWSFPAWKEMRLCADILAGFGDRWRHAHHAAGLLRSFIDDSIAMGPVHGHNLVNEASSSLQHLRNGLADLIRKTMGETCCYLFIEGWDNIVGCSPLGLFRLIQVSSENGLNCEVDSWLYGGPNGVEFL